MAPCSRSLLVKGEIKNNKGVTYHDACELFMVDDGKKVKAPWSEKITGKFSVAMSITPYRSEYALQIECEGFRPYKTGLFEASHYSDIPYDMGVVEIVPEN